MSSIILIDFFLSFSLNFIKYEEYDEKTDPAQGIRGADFVDFTKKAFVDKFYEGKYTDENFAKADAALVQPWMYHDLS